MTQLSNEQTTSATESVEFKEEFSLISNDKLLRIYAAMLKCRMTMERVSLLRMQGKLCGDSRLSAGREASAAAVVGELQPEDTLSLADGDLMPCLVKGVRTESLLRVLADGGNDPSHDALFNILMPSKAEAQTTGILEFSLREKDKKMRSIAVAFLANNAASHSQWKKMMSLAGKKNLPVVFVWHRGVPAEQHDSPTPRRRNTTNKALVNGIPAIAVDGGDAVALYRVACEAILRARQGRGPTLVESYMFPGFEPAAKEENSIYKESDSPGADPIVCMENYLRRKNLWSNQFKQRVVDDSHQDLDLATRFLND